jgi:hypothetical protein
MSGERRAAFFFGSGISRDSKAPMVGDITDALLNSNWEAHTDSRFYPSKSQSSGKARLAQEFVRLLKAQIDPHLQARDNREANYEDLFAAALQIVQDETFEIINPLIADTVSVIRAAAADLFRDLHAHIDDNAFASLADIATDLVQWVVYHKLSPAVTPIGMDTIAATASAVTSLDIFSLNHDLLIERLLRNAGIPFADGFAEADGDVTRFNWSWNQDVPVRLYKLHGSVDWYRFRFPTFVQFGKVRGDPEHCKNADGTRLSLLDSKPLFLTGTTVKEQLYGVSVVGELFTQFRARLSNHHTLICCGYGWSDKGINTRLRQWLYDAPQNRIVILHNNPAEDLSLKRFWYWYWEDLAKAGKVLVIPRWLNECAVADLEPFFST